MLFKIDNLASIWNVRPIGVLHVGAHNAEEAHDYERLNWGNVIWVEAQPNLAANLKKKLDPEKHKVIAAAIWGKSGVELEFKVSSNTQSSSLLDFGTHKDDYPDISITESYQVITSTLQDVLDDSMKFDFLNLDIQGVELEALQGIGVYFEKIKWIYTEVNKSEVYKNCSLIDDVDDFLKKEGFKRVATRWVKKQGWGDALYVRENFARPLTSRVREFIDYLQWLESQRPSFKRAFRRILKYRKIDR